jgi:hypothetical protein
MYKAPVFDLTTCIEVDDLFLGPGIDQATAWSFKAMGDFVDAVVYGLKPSYFAPLKYSNQHPDEVQTCALVEKMRGTESLKPTPVAYHAYKADQLKETEFRDFMERFASWLLHKEHEGNRQRNVRAWLETQARYRVGHEDRIPGGVLFPYKQFSSESQRFLESVAKQADLSAEELEYTFDVCYRRILYESETPRGEHFIHHPLRDVCRTKDSRIISISEYVVPISFRHWATTVALKLTLPEFVYMLAAIKQALHESPIIEKMNYDITRSEVRDLAFGLKLPAEMKGKYIDVLDSRVLWGTAALGAAATYFEWSKTAGLVVGFGGAVVTLFANRMKKEIPDVAVQNGVLKWLVTWPELEEQVIRRNWDD